MKILQAPKGISELDYAKLITVFLIFKAYFFDEPQTIIFGEGDESFEVTLTKENISHLMPPFTPSKSTRKRLAIQKGGKG